MSTKSDLPFGSEFSPSQINLPDLLKLVEMNQGDWRLLESEILSHYFISHGQSGQKDADSYNRRKLANNCKLGLIAYGIIDRDGNFTAFGRSMNAMRHSETQLYEALAKHILLNLNGMNLVQCILDMTMAGEDVNLTSLRDGLAARGIRYPSGGKHPSIMRLWLAKAGLFIGKRWQVDETRLRQILGIDPAEFEVLANFTQEQRAFVRALANSGVSSPQPANEIARLAAATYGIRFPEKSLPKLVLEALVNAGYITAEKTTSGRGAKPFLVSPTPKLVADVINALEALGFKLMRILDMDYLATRLRGSATGGAEVDLIFHSTRLVYSRWQIQCKNTAHVALDDVAKEVGLTSFLRSNVIVIVSTGDIGSEARRYANHVMAHTNLALVMLDRSDLERVIDHPVSLIDIFHREAEVAMKLKMLEM